MGRVIEDLIVELKGRGGSDLHISPGYPIIMRVHGRLEPREDGILTSEQTRQWLTELLDERLKSEMRGSGEADFAIEIPGTARARANVFLSQRGMTGVFRLIPEAIPTLDDLDLPAVVRDIPKLRSGLVLVTGPTGSGKSTTLAAIIDGINSTREAHIITIEDPIEFVHPNKKSLVTQRAVGIHAPSFAEAIRAAGREDPDVILVGEMRDLETIAQALTCAEFGILVFGTLHTNSAAKSVDRIVDSFPADQQLQVRSMLSESLKVALAQRLVRTRGGKGRCAAIETLVTSPAISNLIREGKTAQLHSVMQTGTQSGMQTMDQALAKLVQATKVEYEEALEFVMDTASFQRLVGVVGTSTPPGGLPRPVAPQASENRPATASPGGPGAPPRRPMR